ncbi:unnamed protein product [Acanthoscelides obtectus]|nr:unnamed protein product [Acanthoscelides obtectus]CAK1674902.1 Sodium- and chloride-dependent glycine transporter 2 [Acanthoscelides obtectus]
MFAKGCVNNGYVDTEPPSEVRPASVCEEKAHERCTRSSKRMCATVAVGRRELEGKRSKKRARCNLEDSSTISSSTSQIWPNMSLEYENMMCNTSSDVTTWPKSDDEVEVEKRRRRGSWRGSMRRMDRLSIPTDQSPTEISSQEPVPSRLETAQTTTARPSSAPSEVPVTSRDHSESSQEANRRSRTRSSSLSSTSRRARSLSPSEVSTTTTFYSTQGTIPPASMPQTSQDQNNTTASSRRSRDGSAIPTVTETEPERPMGRWPHSLSPALACLGCTIGLFNVCRFAVLSVHFGANFLLQFMLLSCFFGLPLFTLQLCLGQQLEAGVIDMWRISPLFQGVGLSLLVAQALLGLYSITGVSWMFVFFRDSFITSKDQYRWAEPFGIYRHEPTIPVNITAKLSETIPDYLNGIVLQRHHLNSTENYATVKFQLAFNLAVAWTIIFVSLSKGIRSYGKVVYAFTLIPLVGMFVLCAKVLGLMPSEYINVIFPETAWDEFFLNPRSWLAAGQEAFLTWGLLGASAMQIASQNKHKHLLQRDSSLVIVITFTVLILAAFLANTCVLILSSYGYNYIPSSFEYRSSSVFLRSIKDPLPPNLANTPIRHMIHQSFVVGEKVIRPNTDVTSVSGYQVLRFATELIPATFATLGAEQVSPFWVILFYFILIMFGIIQQLAIWHCVITGIMAINLKVLKSWETTITFFSCACGFVLGLPMATELGIYVVYFFDYTIGSIWWLLIVILLQIVAVFMVRGRPYSGDTVVMELFHRYNNACFLTWAPALLSFTWNVILPVILMVLCVSTFRNGSFRDMFIWHRAPTVEYWSLWTRQVGCLMQLLPILCIPIVAVIQSYRYLNNGPDDILERVQLLYRPPIGEHMSDPPIANSRTNTGSAPSSGGSAPAEDPPPKYTPPPSYTTATGVRLAKLLRQSIRRSVRRIAAGVLGEPGSSRQRNTIRSQEEFRPAPPPDYNAVLVEMNSSGAGSENTATSTSDAAAGTTICTTVPDGEARRISTLQRLRNLESTSTALTAAEVASILRSSFRRSTIRRNRSTGSNDRNLVQSAAPMSETSLVVDEKDKPDVM